MSVTFRDRYRMTLTNTPGTSGDFVINAAYPGFQKFDAGDEGLKFDIIINETVTDWEIRKDCTYASGTLSRGTFVDSSTGSALTLTNSATIAVTLLAQRTLPTTVTSAQLHDVIYFNGNDWVNSTIATALGYTPYDASNPAGYTSNTGTVTNVTGGGPITVSTGTTTPAISISPANATTDGYLSAADWITFNSKLSTLPTASTTVLGGVKVDGTSITISGGVISAATSGGGTVTNVSGTGPISVTNPSTTPSISISQASTSTNGYLSSTDWNTFNNKGAPYTLPVATTSVLGGVKADGTTITVAGDGTITATAATSAGYTTLVKQYVKNNTGVALTKGQAVYITGADGTNVLIGLAKADAESTSSKTLGLLEQDLAVNGLGYVITDGSLAGTGGAVLNTGTATIGDPVWLSPTTAGGIVFGLSNKPVAPYHMVYIGVVSRVSTTVGEIIVKVQNGFELQELHNVLINGTANNDILTYESSTSLWKNKQLASGQVTTALGFTPYDATNPAGYTTNTGTVTNVTATGPISVSTGTTTPAISISQATTSTNGYLSSTDWNTFNNKGAPYTLPTASTTVLGGVKVDGTSITISGGVISAISGGAGTVTNVTASAPLSVTNGSSTPAITISQATTSTNGYLSSTDWNTFNNKQATLSAANTTTNGYLTSTDWNTFNNKQAALGFTPYDATNPAGYTSNVGTVTSVSATGPISVATGTTTPAISISQANTTTNGYLSSTDWNTFNNKGNGTVTSVSALTLGTTGTDISSSVATGTTTPIITLNIPTASATNRGVLSSADWTTFNNKGNGTVTSVTATGPLSSTGGTTPGISITQATTSTNGYLSSTDWNTFNGKQAALGYTPYDASNPAGYTTNTGTVTNVTATGPISVATGTTTPGISITQATTSTDGYLSSTDWNTFNNKLSSYTLPTATTSVLGGVKVDGTTITISGGVISSTGGGGGTTAGFDAFLLMGA